MPEIPEDAALLRITAAGICGVDVRAYERPLDDHGPLIMGHENVGRVFRIGKEAEKRWGLKEGDRIALEGYRGCGHCMSCMSGYVGFCPGEGACDHPVEPGSLQALQPSRNGGFSQYFYLHPNTRFHRLADHVPDEQAALAIPFGNGWQWAYFDGGAGPGKTVLIQGPGQQGLGCLVASRQAGADQVIVAGLERDLERLEAARRLGADHTINVEKEDLREKTLEVTGGRGVDVVIDVAAGSAATVLPAIDLLKPRGTLVVIPATGPLSDFPIDAIQRKGITLKGAIGHSFQAVELALQTIASGKHAIEAVSSHQFSLEEVDYAIQCTAGEGAHDAIHVSVDPWRE